MRRPYVVPLAGALTTALAALAALAACTTTVSGSGTAEGTPRATGPLPSFGESVTLVESRRLAFATPRPDVIDGGFNSGCIPTYPVKSVDALSVLFVEDTIKVLRENGFVAAYAQCRNDIDKKGDVQRSTVASAIEMRDEPSALAAAKDMVPTLAKEGDEVGPLREVDGATSILGKDSDKRSLIQTVVPHGRLLLYQWSADADATRLAATAVRTLESALERADEFEPTPLEEMNDLQDDPRGLRRLLYKPPGGTLVTGGGYDLDGYWGKATEPDFEVALLRDSGFKGFYQHEADSESYGVYELADADAVNRVMDEFGRIDKRHYPGITPLAVPGLPQPSSCVSFLFEEETAVQRCYFGRGEHMWQVETYGFEAKKLRDPAQIGKKIANQLAVAPK